MQRPKVLSFALSVTRFSVSDIVNLSELPENTVRDALRDMEQRGYIERSGYRSSRTGRRSELFAWTEGGRVAAIAELSELVPGWIAPGPFPSAIFEDVDPFDTSLKLARGLLEMLENRTSLAMDDHLLQRLQAELAMLRNAVRGRSEDDAALVAILSTKMEEIGSSAGGNALKAAVARQSKPLVDAMRTLSRNDAPPATPERLDGGFGLILDVTRRHHQVPGLLDDTIRGIGRPTVMLRFHGHDEAVVDKALNELSTFLTTPASSIARIFLVVGSGASLELAKRLVRKLTSPRELGASIKRSRRLSVLSKADENHLFLQGSLPAAADEWYVQGAMRCLAIGRAVNGAMDVDYVEPALGKAALNNPYVIFTTTHRGVAKGPFGAFRHGSADDVAQLRGVVLASFLSTSAAMQRIRDTVPDYFLPVSAGAGPEERVREASDRLLSGDNALSQQSTALANYLG